MHFNSFIEYLQFEKNYSPNTITAYSKDIESFFDFASKQFGYSEIKNIHYSIIRNWIVKLVDDGVSNTTINRKISSLRTYYKFLIKIGDLKVSPLLKHKALKTAKKIQVPFSEKEIEEVLNLLKDQDSFLGARNKLIVELFYSTGIRRGEMVNLKLIDKYWLFLILKVIKELFFLYFFFLKPLLFFEKKKHLSNSNLPSHLFSFLLNKKVQL